MKTGMAYLGTREPEYVARDMEELARSGYSHVVHTYSETDFLYNKDTMREILELSARQGLKVYVTPLGIGRVFPGHALSELAARNHSQAQINNLGTAVVASCINHKSFQQYMRDWVQEVCETPIDSVLWMLPDFYKDKANKDTWCCCCETCQKLFRKRFRHLMPNGLTPSVMEFRDSSVVEFLAELTGLVHTKGKKNSVLLGSANNGDSTALWEKIAELPSVDELGVAPYWDKGAKLERISKSYHENSRKLIKIADKYKKEPQVWIKNFSIPKHSEDSVVEATYAAYNEGIRNIFAWSFKGAKCTSSTRSDDCERVWQIQTEALAECLEKGVMNDMIDTLKTPQSSID